MEDQYKETYQSMYDLVCLHNVKNLDSIAQKDKYVIVNLLFLEMPENVAINIVSGDLPIPFPLVKNLIDLDEKAARMVREQAVNYFWEAGGHILQKIFDEAIFNHEYKLDSRSDDQEHLAIDNRERSRDIDSILHCKY